MHFIWVTSDWLPLICSFVLAISISCHKDPTMAERQPKHSLNKINTEPHGPERKPGSKIDFKAWHQEALFNLGEGTGFFSFSSWEGNFAVHYALLVGTNLYILRPVYSILCVCVTYRTEAAASEKDVRWNL